MFLPETESIYWTAIDHFSPMKQMLDPVQPTWERASQAFPRASLFGADGEPRPEDVIQGASSDCWMLSAMSGVAEYPGFIRKMFVNTNQSLQNGQSTLYGVTLYPLGMPYTVFVDDYLHVYM